MARIALIVGSVRENRQGIKVVRWMEGTLKSRDHTVYFIDNPVSNHDSRDYAARGSLDAMVQRSTRHVSELTGCVFTNLLSLGIAIVAAIC
jgi:NAD(P)H-dependent FMN reductase